MPPRKAASKIVPINGAESTVPEPPTPGNILRPQTVERTEATAEIRRFLEVTRHDLFAMFLSGTSEYKLTERMGGRSQRVCRLDIESALRESAREERQARLEAERQLRVMRRYAA